MALDWFILAIIATLLWSIAAIIVKFVRVNYIKSSIGYIMITAPLCFLGLFLLLLGKFQIPSAKMLIYIFATAMFGLFGYWLYILAIHKEEISRVITLFGIQPLVTLVLAIIVLEEALTLNDYLAFPLIIIGSMLISVKKIEERFQLSTGTILVIISIFFYGTHKLLLKLLSEVNFVSVMIIRWFFMLIVLFLFFMFSKEIRKRTKGDLKQLNKKKLCLIYAAESISMMGVVFSYLAIQRGPVSLVTLVEGTEGLFVIILATLLSIFIPKILKEEISKKTISLKIISALLILAGLYLIAI